MPDSRKLERVAGCTFKIPLETIVDDVIDDQRRKLEKEKGLPKR